MNPSADHVVNVRLTITEHGRYDYWAMTKRNTTTIALKRPSAGRVARFDFPDRSAT